MHPTPNKRALIDQVNEATMLKQSIGNLWSSVIIIKQMIRNHCSGAYGLNPIVLVAFSTALVYLINPLDVIPDAIPVFGYSDDAAVILATLQQFNEVISHFKIWKQSQDKLNYSSDQEILAYSEEKQLIHSEINNKNNFPQTIIGQTVSTVEKQLLSDSILQEIKQIKRHYQRLMLMEKIDLEQICFSLQEQQKKLLRQIQDMQKCSNNYERDSKLMLRSVRRFKEQVEYLEDTMKQIKSNDKKLKSSRERIEGLQKDLEKKNERPYINFVFGCLLTILLLYL